MQPLLSGIIWDEQTLAVVGAFAVPLAAIIGTAWYKLNKVRYENDLKRAMIERGMSVDEIERVISAGVEKDEE
jgi:hypothetical protein